MLAVPSPADPPRQPHEEPAYNRRQRERRWRTDLPREVTHREIGAEPDEVRKCEVGRVRAPVFL
jgi:hypothetical protein